MKTVTIEKLTVRWQQRSPVEEFSPFRMGNFMESRVYRLKMFGRTRKTCLVNRQKSEHQEACAERAQLSQQFSLMCGEKFEIH